MSFGWPVGRVYLFLGGNSVWLLLFAGVTSLVWNIFVLEKMAEEKERRIEAAVSVGDEDKMDETYVVSESSNDDTRRVICDELEITDSTEEEQGTEQEHAAWAGRVPLSQSLSSWSVERERERLVTVCMKI